MKWIEVTFVSLVAASLIGAARDWQVRGQRRPSRWIAEHARRFYRWILGI